MSGRALVPALALAALASCLSQRALPDGPPKEPAHELRERLHPRTGVRLAQWEVLVYADGREVKDGVERERYPSGALRAERRFEDGAPAGLWRTWYESAELRSKYEYAPDGSSSPMRFWHPNGRLSAEGLARDGQRVGIWTAWWPNGLPREQGAYFDGRRHGPWTFWRSDGSLDASGSYEAGQRVGRWERGGDDGPREAAAPAPTRP